TDNEGVNYVEYSIDYSDWQAMTRKANNEYEAQWDTSGENEGNHEISIKAVDTSKNEIRDDITVSLGYSDDAEETTPGFEVSIVIIAAFVILIMFSKRRYLR
ncbi:MAG: hypothetical protein KAJ51_01080, partial [Thermoplasmata archaeon]|nr:hypothetical protein [Thermoplasmata archaeon]